MITIAEIKKWIEEIKQLGYDPEIAHSKEDDLFRDVLTAIAKDPTHAQALAKEALKATKLDFERWKA